MKGSRWVAAAGAAATLLFTGCSSSTELRSTGGQVASATAVAQPVICRVDMKVPGFEVTDTRTVPQADRIGQSVRLRDGAGRKLLLTSGVPGDFAEGATSRGQVAAPGGAEGQLYGAGSVWVITWDEGGPCGTHAVIGNDIGKHGFIVAMSRAGVIQPGD